MDLFKFGQNIIGAAGDLSPLDKLIVRDVSKTEPDGGLVEATIAQVMEAAGSGLTDIVVGSVIGGTAAGSDLTLQSTSGVGVGGDTILMKVGNNGDTTVATVSSTGLALTGVETITSASASSFAVGRLGATTPAFVVDSSTGSQAAGLKVTGATTTGTVAVATDGGAAVNLTINAKGTGTIGIGSVSTGEVTITPATTITGAISTPSSVTARSSVAVPASAGAVAAGPAVSMFSTNISLWVTSDTPAFSATKGDICINTGGSSSSTRLFINNGTTNWVAITTAS